MPQRSMYEDDAEYRVAMGQLLMLYTQVDRLIMQVCAERIASAPDIAAELSLAKQTGDESRHVSIQCDWLEQFAPDSQPLISPEQEMLIRAHFRKLPWRDFLVDLYLCVEALGSEAVERIVPLADPGTRRSLDIPLADELNHVAFGMMRLKQELDSLPGAERDVFLEGIPGRIDALTRAFHGFGLEVGTLFAAVGADYPGLCRQLAARRQSLLDELAA